MTVSISTATVYFGGRRRWFSLEAACRAEAKLRFKTDDENDEDFETRVPQLAAEARAEFDRSAPEPDYEESRALAACRALVATRSEVERLGHLIGDSLSTCQEAWFREQEKTKEPWHIDFNAYQSHLKAAYEPTITECTSQYEDGDVVYRDHAAIVAMLAVCPHCLAAHNAIQERKAARRRLGAARRAITMIGRSK